MNSLSIYKLNTKVLFTEESLAEIERLTFTPCGEFDASKTGFSSTVDGTLVAEISGNTVLVVTQQEKKPNRNQVKVKLEERVKAFEEKMNVKANKDDKSSMEAEIVRSLLPNVFPNKEVHTTVIFTDEYLLVESGSPKKAEDIVSMLRSVLGSLQAIPLQTVKSPEEVLGSIIVKNTTEFLMGEKIVISTDNGSQKGKSSFAKDNVYDQETKRLVNSGSFVDTIQLGLEDTLFTIKADLSISGIKFSKSFLSEVDKSDEAGSFILKMGEIELLVAELVETMGGIVE